jgi:hypothetical protein
MLLMLRNIVPHANSCYVKLCWQLEGVCLASNCAVCLVTWHNTGVYAMEVFLLVLDYVILRDRETL